MGDHCALGPAGGARGVDKNGDISRFAGFAAGLDQTSVGLQIVTADVTQLLQRDDLWIVELAQAFHVEDHHLADSWQFMAYIKEFVELLVALDEQIDRCRVIAQVLDLWCCIGRIDAITNAAGRLDREIGPDPFAGSVGQY